jgi:predicted aminopeptidase
VTPRPAVVRRALMVAGAALLLSSCSTLSYYGEIAHGHVALLESARPIDSWLDDPATSPALRARLEKVRAIRRYASDVLALPDNASYRSYASLDRPYVVWNVFAAPALSLELKQWCFPIAGCVTYRGYFVHQHALDLAHELRAKGDDVMVGGVPAYSTLGHTPDPVLSTFIDYPDGELARLIFHELGHQEFYLAGDSTFNESFASTVEAEGARRWLATEANDEQRAQYARHEARKAAFLALTAAAREQLLRAYAVGPDDATRLSAKDRILGQLRADYQKARNDPSSALYQDKAYEEFFGVDLNNASLAALATYTQRVPAFAKLLEQEHGDLPRFYAAVKALGALDPEAREARLDALQASAAPTATDRP